MNKSFFEPLCFLLHEIKNSITQHVRELSKKKLYMYEYE